MPGGRGCGMGQVRYRVLWRAHRPDVRILGSGAGSGGRLDHGCARDHASRHRVIALLLPADLDLRDRVAPVEHAGIEIGEPVDAAADMNEAFAILV